MNSCKENQPESVPASHGFDNERGGALYVHVPFCRAKCRYCDFYSHVDAPEVMDAYLEAVLAEQRLRASEIRRPITSLYFGGGTPTALGADRLKRLLRALTPLTGEDAEISVETNPGTVDAAVAEALVEGGVNRVTLGAQSFNDEELAFLGRIHRAEDIAQAAEILRVAGVANLAMDLIYALPGQSSASWEHTLAVAVSLQPRHVSCYALSFEDDTPLGDDLQAGRVEEVDDETQRGMFDRAVEFLQTAGYEHYELSNFAQPGCRCRQNLVYWRNESYLGLGPGACSYLHGIRRTNPPDTAAYVHHLTASPPTPPPSRKEQLTGQAAMAETLMLGLRLTEGVEISTFTRRFGLAPTEAFPVTFQRYLRQGSVQVTPTHVRLHRNALFTSNCILADLLGECE